MTHELEEEQYEEEDTNQPMDDEPITSSEQPITGGHLPFREMGITYSITNRVMDVCNVTFDHLKKRIVKERHRYYPYDPQNPVSVVTDKVIMSNTRRNMREVMATNVAFATST